MKKSTLLKNLIVKLAILASLIVVLGLISLYINSILSDKIDKKNWLRSDINSLSRKLSSLNRKFLEFSDAVKIWEELDPERKSLGGLRINYAKDLLDKASKEHFLTDLKTTFSKPAEVNYGKNIDSVQVMSSNVSITFKSLTDEIALAFIKQIMSEYPGYTQITKLTMVKSNEVVDKKLLENIAQGNFPRLVSVELNFIWRDLKKVETSQQSSQANR